MNNRVRVTLSLALFVCLSCSAPNAGEMPTFGYLEHVQIGDAGLLVRAKLDTGADSSSLNAADLEISKRGGQSWARFSVTNFEGKTAPFDVPIKSFVRIKRHGGESLRRPVVELPICLGKLRRLARVTLANRSGFNFQVLIGRSFLAGNAVVDSGRSYTAPPNCPAG